MAIKYLNYLMAMMLMSCAGSRSELAGASYSIDNDITTYTRLPYGTIELPGKWNIGEYRRIDRRQYLVTNDSVQIGISMAYAKDYPFAKSMGDVNEFVRTYYEWETKYYSDTLGADVRLIENDSDKGYMIWAITYNNATNIFMEYLQGQIAIGYQYIVKKGEENEKGIQLIKSVYMLNLEKRESIMLNQEN